MLGYEGRCVLLDDAGEWVNIPFVVREFVKQLNDESHATRAMVESLRQEQKETNLLLRRVLQKQADLEIDNQRNALSINQHASRAVRDSVEPRHAAQLEHVRKKTDKLDDRMHQLSERVEALSKSVGASAATAAEAVADVKSSIADLTRSTQAAAQALDSHARSLAEVQQAARGRVDPAEWAAVREAQESMARELAECRKRDSDARRDGEAVQGALSIQQAECDRMRGVCEGLHQAAESDRRTFTERLTACLRTVEKLEELSMVRHAEGEARWKRIEQQLQSGELKIREEGKTHFAELRGLLREREHETHERTLELAGELRSVKEQQRRAAEEQADARTETAALSQRIAKQTRELAGQVDGVAAEVQQLSCTVAQLKGQQGEQAALQASLNTLKQSLNDSVGAAQTQAQQLAASMKTMRTEQGEDNDWLHNELGRVGTVVGYVAQQREKQERQVASLCEIVQNLSSAVASLEAERAGRAAAAPGKGEPSTVTAAAPVEVPSAWEEWRASLQKEVEARLAAGPPASANVAVERVSQQLNELTAKVDGGAKYTQALLSQQAEQLRYAVREEVSHQLQSHAALREVAPALVEVEAVKRRLAAAELGVQTLTTDAGGSGGASLDALQHQRRLAHTEEAVDGLKRRLLELAESVTGVDERGSEVARRVDDVDARVRDQQRVVLKLGTDLTAALESLLHTEESFSLHEAATTRQLTELRRDLDVWRGETTEATVASSVDREAGASVARCQADVTRLAAAVERLSTQVARHDEAALRATPADPQPAQSGQASPPPASAAAPPPQALAHLCEVGGVTAAVEAVQGRLAALESSHTVAGGALQTLTGRVDAMERCLAEVVDGVANTAQCADAVAQCQARLDAVEQQQVQLQHATEARRSPPPPQPTPPVPPPALDRAEEEAQVRDVVASQLRTVESAWVDAAAVAAALRCREELTLAATAASTAVAGDAAAHVARMQAVVEEVRHCLDACVAGVGDCQHRTLAVEATVGLAAGRLHALETTHDDLREELQTLHAMHAAHAQETLSQVQSIADGAAEKVREVEKAVRAAAPPSDAAPPGSSTHTASGLDAVKQVWLAEAIASVQATVYTKAVLEERLENIWASMVDLLARKEDVIVVHDKLNGLHRLMQEEMQIELERREEELANQLAEKVSLTNLQDILEHHFGRSSSDADDGTA